MEVTRSNSHTLAFETFGSSADKKVLLIMGYGMRGEAWRRQIPALSEEFHVATFDHAGIGASGPIAKQRLEMSDLVHDTRAVLDALEWDDVHVVGISMGGMIAQNLALIEKRARSLTLIATHAGGFPRTLPPLKGLNAFARANFSKDKMAALAELLFPEEYLLQHRDSAIEMLREDFQSPPPALTRLAQLHAVSTHRAAPRLHELSLPTLVVQAGRDQLIHPAHSEELARLIPGSVLERIPEAGHGIVRQTPDKLNAMLMRHLLAN